MFSDISDILAVPASDFSAFYRTFVGAFIGIPALLLAFEEAIVESMTTDHMGGWEPAQF